MKSRKPAKVRSRSTTAEQGPKRKRYLIISWARKPNGAMGQHKRWEWRDVVR